MQNLNQDIFEQILQANSASVELFDLYTISNSFKFCKFNSNTIYHLKNLNLTSKIFIYNQTNKAMWNVSFNEQIHNIQSSSFNNLQKSLSKSKILFGSKKIDNLNSNFSSKAKEEFTKISNQKIYPLF